MLVLGYAGWGEGQLEDELTENVWLTAEPTLELLFDDDHASKWSRALAGIGVDAAMLSAQGGRADPCWFWATPDGARASWRTN